MAPLVTGSMRMSTFFTRTARSSCDTIGTNGPPSANPTLANICFTNFVRTLLCAKLVLMPLLLAIGLLTILPLLLIFLVDEVTPKPSQLVEPVLLLWVLPVFTTFTTSPAESVSSDHTREIIAEPFTLVVLLSLVPGMK
jgi:hypothetical protein